MRITIFCIGDTTLTAEVDGTLRTSMAVLSEEGRLDVAWNRQPAVEEEDFHGVIVTSFPLVRVLVTETTAAVL